jgi:hypothetical protein
MDMSEKIKDGLIIDSKGTKYWYKGGYLHRLDGPACKWSNGDMEWVKHGSTHRIDGPAMEFTNGQKYWFLYGKEYDEEEYKIEISNIPLLYWNQYKMGLWI